MLFNSLLASITILLCFFFLFGVVFNNLFIIPVDIGNVRLKLAPHIPPLMYCITYLLYLSIFYFAFFLNHLKCLDMHQQKLYLFLSFKETTHAYLLKLSMTHNKNLIPLLNLLINCISAKSTPQILSLNEE